MKDYKLTREQFTDAISKGLGRAMIHIQQYGLDNVADIVLDTCIHNRLYDAQCEQNRSKWLYAMFSDSPQYDNFQNAILAAMRKENEWYDAVQLCELAQEMAMDGDEYARAGLRDFALKSAAIGGDRDDWGVIEYVKVGGEAAVLELARIYGQRLLDNPEDEVNEILFYEQEDVDAYGLLLKEYSYSDPRIKIYFDYLNDKGALDPVEVQPDADRQIERENRRMEFLSQYGVKQIINCAKNFEDSKRTIFRRFGLYADRKELEMIFAELLKAKDDSIRKRLLWVFGPIPLPAINECFFEWADSEDEELRAAVLSAFANCKDERVHEFAYQRIKTGEILGWGNSFVFNLFEKNFERGDGKFIRDAILASNPSIDDIHRFGLSITSIAEKNKTNERRILI